jgi:hypothetical protein
VQVVETLGIRNAKPTADREVVDKYIQHVITPVDDERHQSRPEREGRDGDAEKQQAMARAN